MSKTETNTFPNFQPFTSADFDDYQKFIYRFPQHCDFTLNNMLIWLSGNTSMQYSWLNGNLILRIEEILFTNKISGAWHTILGDNMADESLKELFSNGRIKKLLLVPDYFVNSIKHPESFVITDDLDNRDYILDVEKLINKSGKLYANFRYQISYFLRNYSEDAIIREIDLVEPSVIKEIINSLHLWPRINSFEHNGNDSGRKDAKAIDNLLRLQSILPIKHYCLGLYINGSLHSKDKIAMGNHIKFNSEYNRLFDYLVYATATRLRQQNIKMLNAEQDMGIEGIRKHKAYLNPYTYYEKFSILPK
jgi:hypothetical protein